MPIFMECYVKVAMTDCSRWLWKYIDLVQCKYCMPWYLHSKCNSTTLTNINNIRRLFRKPFYFSIVDARVRQVGEFSESYFSGIRYNRGSLLTVLYYKKSMFWLSNLFWVLCSVYKIPEVCCISFDLSHPNLPYASELSENWVSWDLAEIILPSAIILPWVKSLYYTVKKSANCP